MAYVNQAFDLANSETAIVHLDRWGEPYVAVQLDSGTSILVEGTLDRINRGESPTWQTLDDVDGAAMSAVTPGITAVRRYPVEAIRITATGACVGRVIQTGSE